MNRLKLKFDEEFVVPILSEEKTATIRHNLEDDRIPDETGDPIEMYRHGQDNPFARATIAMVTVLTPVQISTLDIDGHADYDTAGDVIECLSRYYEGDIEFTTELLVIQWRNVKPGDDPAASWASEDYA